MFGMCIICITNGCSDDDPIEADEIRLLSTVPEDCRIVSPTGELTIIFDGFPTSVYVDGKLAIIQGNTAIVKVSDLPNLRPGTDNTVTIEWRNQENLLVGSETITVTVLEPVTVTVTVVVDPAPPENPNLLVGTNMEFTLSFSKEVVAVMVNCVPAMGSGFNWKWTSYLHLPLGPGQFLDIQWTDEDGFTGAIKIGPYNFTDNENVQPPSIADGTVSDGDVDIDPMPINAGGLRYDFDEPVTGTIKLTDEAGVDLNWTGTVAGQTATLTAVAGQELVNETTYKVEIDIADGAGLPLQVTITFVTKPK